MTEIGRLYVKIAGREAGKFCTIVEAMDKQFVIVDGQVRRKKCNIAHLEPLEKTLDLKKGASHADVIKAFEKIGIKITVQPRVQVQNMVAAGEIGMDLNLNSLAMDLENTEYEPEQFP